MPRPIKSAHDPSMPQSERKAIAHLESTFYNEKQDAASMQKWVDHYENDKDPYTFSAHPPYYAGYHEDLQRELDNHTREYNHMIEGMNNYDMAQGTHQLKESEVRKLDEIIQKRNQEINRRSIILKRRAIDAVKGDIKRLRGKKKI